MSAIGDKIADVSLRYQGTPYKWGGHTPSGFDCSGMVAYAVKEATGQVISPDSHAQMTVGEGLTRDDGLQRGDILCWDTMSGSEVREGNPCSHTGIYVGNNLMMNCLNPDLGCRTSDISSDYWKRQVRFLGARRFRGDGDDEPTPDDTTRRHRHRPHRRKNTNHD